MTSNLLVCTSVTKTLDVDPHVREVRKLRGYARRFDLMVEGSDVAYA